MKRICSLMRNAVDTYNMIEENDRIAVGVSGGKDSLVLLYGLSLLKNYYPKKFSIVAVTLDPCFENKDSDFSAIEDFCKKLDVEYHIKRTELYNVVFENRQEKNPCSLCARMRRGILHDMAKAHGCNKIALGHHKDDAAETVRHRLEVYHALTEVLKDFYAQRGKLRLIEGNQSIEAANQDILKAIGANV